MASSTRPGDELPVQSKAKRLLDLHTFCAPGGKVANAQDKEKRVANKVCVKALDHALQTGAGWDLRCFLAQHRIRPLKAHERRYYVQATDCPPEVCSLSQKRRSCVENLDTGHVRLEVIQPVVENRLHAVSDRGAQGWTKWLWLFQDYGLDGSFQHDEAHKDWCTVNGAVNMAGLRP